MCSKDKVRICVTEADHYLGHTLSYIWVTIHSPGTRLLALAVTFYTMYFILLIPPYVVKIMTVVGVSLDRL